MRFNAQSEITLDWATRPRLDDITPGRDIPVISPPLSRAGYSSANRLKFVHWGWWFYAKNLEGKKVKRSVINSREDTIFANLNNPRKIYKKSLSEHRVLIPFEAFYEWPEKGRKVMIKPKTDGISSFGGFTTLCEGDKGFLDTAVMITLGWDNVIHDRRPLIIPREREDEWLKGEAKDLPAFLQSFFDSSPKDFHVTG